MKEDEFNRRQADYERHEIHDRSRHEYVNSIIDPKRHLFPHCLIWTPIPCLTWLFPFIGHMGIATSSGVIRDFAGSYYVSEDEMAFGWPTRYIQLSLDEVTHGSGVSPQDSSAELAATRHAAAAAAWDRAVSEASDVYKRREHNLLLDNCHSHCALALEKMRYKKSPRWNMVRLAAWMFFAGKYVDVASFFKTWLPFMIIFGTVIAVCVISTTL